ncbi:PHP-associated domain-containing protein [Lysinibacillus sp. NPDC097279]|uniref:PHP-associated domain-containing protein n=1 Tax=Lysinibacillus sp. NPDC097279 TaxID=3364143 RepID=UPI003820C68B
MNFDFHTHGKLSKKVEFSLDYFRNMVKSAQENGLSGFALTEHFNTRNFFDVYNTLDEVYPYIQNYYLVDNVRIFPGMEVDIQEVGHILIVADRAIIREIRTKLEPYVAKDSFIKFAQLLELVAQYELLIIGAHPYRKSTPLYHLDPTLLNKLDAFDLNGKDLYSMGIEENSQLVYQFAKTYNKPVIGGSDTHHLLQYGCIYNELEQDCHTITDLKKIILDGRYTIRISNNLPEKVLNATEQKAIEKKMMETATI